MQRLLLLVVLLLSVSVVAFHPSLAKISFSATTHGGRRGLALYTAVEDELELLHVPKVRRVYETWTWRYKDRNFRINYRVAGNESGPPILLV